MEKQRIRVTPATRQMIAQAVIAAPDGYYVQISEPTRSLDQNAKLHSLCSDVAKSLTWMGRKLSTEDWKRLLVDAYVREHGNVDLVPSLDSKGVVTLGQQTRSMGVKEMSELIESIQAYGAENGVQWTEDVHIPGWVK